MDIKKARIRLYEYLRNQSKKTTFNKKLGELYPIKWGLRVDGEYSKWKEIIENGEIDDLICKQLKIKK